MQVGQWKKKNQEQASRLFESTRGPKPLAAHRGPGLLYSKIGKLKMELDWLKKSPGSACHDPVRVDRQSRRGGRGSAMCLAGVSRATVYARQKPRWVDESDLLLCRLIDEEFTRHPFYGSRKMVVLLKAMGHQVNRGYKA